MISPTWWCRHGAHFPDDQDTNLHCLRREENIQSLGISNFRPTIFNESFHATWPVWGQVSATTIFSSWCFILRIVKFHACLEAASGHIVVHLGQKVQPSLSSLSPCHPHYSTYYLCIHLLIRGRSSHAEIASISNYIDTIRHSLYSKLPKSSKKGNAVFSLRRLGKLTIITQDNIFNKFLRPKSFEKMESPGRAQSG